jgi:hypothetical protein
VRLCARLGQLFGMIFGHASDMRRQLAERK